MDYELSQYKQVDNGYAIPVVQESMERTVRNMGFFMVSVDSFRMNGESQEWTRLFTMLTRMSTYPVRLWQPKDGHLRNVIVDYNFCYLERIAPEEMWLYEPYKGPDHDGDDPPPGVGVPIQPDLTAEQLAEMSMQEEHEETMRAAAEDALDLDHDTRHMDGESDSHYQEVDGHSRPFSRWMKAKGPDELRSRIGG